MDDPKHVKCDDYALTCPDNSPTNHSIWDEKLVIRRDAVIEIRSNCVADSMRQSYYFF